MTPKPTPSDTWIQHFQSDNEVVLKVAEAAATIKSAQDLETRAVARARELVRQGYPRSAVTVLRRCAAQTGPVLYGLAP